MAIPAFVIAAGWIPFVVVIVLAFLFSAGYIRYFMSKYDSELSTTLAAICAMTVTLLTSALVPVDIFMVSFMKTPEGEFKDWANNSEVRADVETTVLNGYYTLYGLITFCLFILLPFMYFFYEEKEDDIPCKSRCCSALKYLIVFVLIAATLLLIGAFVPTKQGPSVNGTEWKKIEALFKDLATNGGEDALSFVISIFSLIGMLAIIMYLAYGMSSLPLDLIKGQQSAKKERMTTATQRTEASQRRQAIRQKYASGRTISSRDQERVSDLEEQERLMNRREQHLAEKENSCLQKCLLIFRPFEVVFGVIFILLALLIIISLLLTNIDKAMHSLGYKFGYALPRRSLPNPIDITLVFCQKVFPLDYILISGIMVFLVLCAMSGIRNIGVWFLWIKMYKIRPRRTRPQGLLMFVMIMIYVVLAMNILLYELTPQYSSFGSQHYTPHSNVTNGTDPSGLVMCTTESSSDDCMITRMALLLTRFFYKMWFFGAAYYWLTWVFIGFYFIGLIVAAVRRRKSAIQGEVEDSDFEESDDEMIRG